MDNSLEKTLDEIQKILEDHHDKCIALWLVLQNNMTSVEFFFLSLKDKIIEFEKLISAEIIDFDLCEIKKFELMECKESLHRAMQLFDDDYNTYLLAIQKLSEMELKFGKVIFNVQLALHNHHEALIEHQDITIQQYSKGIRKRHVTINEKWDEAKSYLKEELQKNPNMRLKDARKNAASRASIYVEERQLINKLPDPRENRKQK